MFHYHSRSVIVVSISLSYITNGIASITCTRYGWSFGRKYTEKWLYGQWVIIWIFSQIPLSGQNELNWPDKNLARSAANADFGLPASKYLFPLFLRTIFWIIYVKNEISLCSHWFLVKHFENQHHTKSLRNLIPFPVLYRFLRRYLINLDKYETSNVYHWLFMLMDIEYYTKNYAWWYLKDLDGMTCFTIILVA